MSRILVLYGTTDGHTAKIAQSIGDALRAVGNDADVIEAGTADPRPEDYTAVIVAGSVHAGGYQRSIRRWVRRHARVLNTQPTAFVSVCLAVLQQEAAVQRELTDIIDRFLAAIQFLRRDGSPNEVRYADKAVIASLLESTADAVSGTD